MNDTIKLEQYVKTCVNTRTMTWQSSDFEIENGWKLQFIPRQHIICLYKGDFVYRVFYLSSYSYDAQKLLQGICSAYYWLR